MILVLGAGGNVGRALVGELAAAGAAFRAAHRSPAKVEEARQAGRDAVLVDVTRPETVRGALAGASALFLLTPETIRPDSVEAAIVEEAARAGVRRVVKQSVWKAHDGYTLGDWHRPMEQAIEASGIPFTFLRPNNFMQNLVNLCAHDIKAEGAFYFPAGEARSSFIDVRDIAKVAAKALTEPGHEGKIYELSGPEALDFHDVAGKLARAAGRPIRYVPLDPEAYRQYTSTHFPPEFLWLVEPVIDLYHRYMSRGAFADVTPDVERVLGSKPLSFDRFAEEHAGAFR
jgi:uncharacterized protein YbjT (DUF2867 family)